MNNNKNSIGDRIINLWRRLSPIPGGAWLFSKIFGFMVPYSGSISATVKQLSPGYARIELRDHRKIRNHLNCIHAIALLNLGELATGMALLTGLHANNRGIITSLSMSYFKKARGRLIAIAETKQPDVKSEIDHEVVAEIQDQSGDVVARCIAHWRLGPIP